MRTVVAWSVIVAGAVEPASRMLGLDVVERVASFVTLVLLWGVMLHFVGTFEVIGSFVNWFTNRIDGATARIEGATERLKRNQADDEPSVKTTFDVDGVSEELAQEIRQVIAKNIEEINRKIELIVVEARREESSSLAPKPVA